MKHLLILLTFLFIFTGCGGGGGSAGGAPTIPLIADAGADQTVTAGTSVQVDARGSINDPDRVYTFHWEFLDKPAGSTSVLVTESAINPFFSPDKEGEYILQLTVSDNEGHHATDIVIITVFPAELHTDTYKMILDLNRSSVSTDISHLTSRPLAKTVNDNYAMRPDISASVSRQGRYGTFTIDGFELTYHKEVETNATDTGEIIVHMEGEADTLVTVTIESLYWKQIASNNYTTIALKSDGTLWAWGANNNTFGTSLPSKSLVPIQEETHATDWKSVSLGDYHVLALKEDNTLWTWGNNTQGELGTGTRDWGTFHPQQLGTESNWEKVMACTDYSLAIKQNGTLWAWGNNSNGQLGDGTREEKLSPIRITESTDWESIFCGYSSSFAIKHDGSLWAWGYNFYFSLGDGSAENRFVPVRIGSDTDWKSISIGHFHTLGIKNNGTLWAWGYNENGQIGDSTITVQRTPVQIGSTHWKHIAAGEEHSLALKEDGTLWAWGMNQYNQQGDPNKASVLHPRIISTEQWDTVSTATQHSIGIDKHGRIWGWGYNEFGQLGNGTSDLILQPTEHPETTDIKQLLSTFKYTILLKTDGTIWTWGINKKSQLGHSPGIKYVPYPKQESTHATDWKQVAQGDNHIIALKENGTVWTWGDNYYGQLGLGDRSNRPEARPITTLGNNTVAICAGRYFSAALKNDGTLWTWGAFTFSSDSNTLPVQEASEGTTWHALSCGGDFILALRDGGELWSWGANRFGQLANGTTTFTPVPQREATHSLWESISAGLNYSIGIKADGTLWGWGANGYHNVGSEDAQSDQILPIQESTHANNWAMASAGLVTTLALKHDYTLWSWGENSMIPHNQAYPVAYRSPTPIEVEMDEPLVSYPLWLHTDPQGSNTLITQDHHLWTWGKNDNNQLMIPWKNPVPALSITRSE